MDLAYPLLALAVVVVALVVLAVVAIALGEWVRWLLPHGAVAAAALALVAAAVVNTGVPRSCTDGEVPDRQRPFTAVLDSTGECRRTGLGQVALVPLAGVGASLLVTRWPRRSPQDEPGRRMRI